jgi:hypothetical protein
MARPDFGDLVVLLENIPAWRLVSFQSTEQLRGYAPVGTL